MFTFENFELFLYGNAEIFVTETEIVLPKEISNYQNSNILLSQYNLMKNVSSCRWEFIKSCRGYIILHKPFTEFKKVCGRTCETVGIELVSNFCI